MMYLEETTFPTNLSPEGPVLTCPGQILVLQPGRHRAPQPWRHLKDMVELPGPGAQDTWAGPALDTVSATEVSSLSLA